MKRRLLFIASLLCIFHLAYGNDPTKWTDDKAYDDSWFEDSKTEFTISSPKELGGLAKKVNTDNISFEGVVINLAADVEMSQYNWVSINEFKGTFNGNGHSITSLKTASTSTNTGLFATVTDGEIKNVIVSGEAKDASSNLNVGGVVGVLNNGKVSNVGYIGKVVAAKATVTIGGVVGKNEGGTISNSFFSGDASSIFEGAMFGNVVGSSTGTVTDSYFLFNETNPEGIGEGTGTNVEAKDIEAFESGEVAWLLNKIGDSHTGIWGQSDNYPVLANKNNKAIYKVNYSSSEFGNVSGLTYTTAGTIVELVKDINESYMLGDISVTNTSLIDNSSFVMPASDVDVTYTIVPIPAEITAFSAEEIDETSFVAKWNTVDGASDYLITVKKNGVVMEQYNAVSTGNITSLKIEGLSSATAYSYTLQSVTGVTPSEASNEVFVVTKGFDITIQSAEKYSFIAQWNSLEGIDKYLVSLFDGEQVITEYNDIEVTDSQYQFSGLNANKYYTCQVKVVYAVGVERINRAVLSTMADYGVQLNNSGFEVWDGVGQLSEPIGWHSFMTCGGSLASTARKMHMEKSADTRPGSSGSLSSRIWTLGIIGVPANGNLTTGRIMAGSTDPGNTANHNISQIEDPDFSAALHGAKPDSLTVWVKYNPVGTDQQARISAVIHDSYDFKEPTADEEILSHVVGKAVLNYPATENKSWQRVTIPFNYSGPAESADYMLVTFATNMTPGGGVINDEVIIDDLLLIYNPSVEISETEELVFDHASEISIDYTLEGTMSPSNLQAAPNVVSLQLSDADGSFDNPQTLVEVTTDYSGTLVAQLSEDLWGEYKVRVVTTNYPMVSEPVQITINNPTAVISASEVDDFITIEKVAVQQIITVEGEYITGEIAISLESDEFSADKETLPAEGGEIVITYSPQSVGNHSATLTLSAEGANDIIIDLIGTANSGPTSVTIENGSLISIYPNPVIDFIYVNGAEENSKYSIYTIVGNVIKKNELVGKIDVTDLTAGVYLLEVGGTKVKFIKK